MTLHIADIASYQGSLTIAQLRAAGFGGVNVKVSHGVGKKSVHPNADAYVREARAAGMALSCFHWLDASASGTAQADYAYRQMALLGLNVPGVAHVVDVESTESPPTQAILQDYVQRMVKLTQRFVIVYTGDWYWPKTWASPSPYLWSAPAAGYQPAYPGDASELWDAGYGGWETLSVMQYRVAKVAGIDVSQSAVRSLDLWAELTGVPSMAWKNIPSLLSLRDEFNEAFPVRDKASDGFIGDGEHSTRSSDHNPDETGATPYEDSDSINEVHAYDADSTLREPGWTMMRCAEIIRKRHASGQDARLQNIICDRKITSRSWGFSEWRDYEGSDPHTGHAHFSARYGSGTGSSNPENQTQPWGILAAMEGEDDMTPAEMTAWAKSSEGKAALVAALAGPVADAVWAEQLEDPYDTANPKRKVAAGGWQRYSPSRGQVQAVGTLVQQLAALDQVDEAALGTAIGAALAAQIELPEGVITEQGMIDAVKQAMREGTASASPDSPSA